MTKLNFKNQKGFGLFTVLIVLLMLSLFTTYVIVTQTEGLAASQLYETEYKAERLRIAINEYKSHHITASYVTAVGAPPLLNNLVNDDGDGCVGDNVTANPSYLTLQGWCGPYLEQEVNENSLGYQTDGWGNLFTYNSGTEVITSFGPNGNDDSGGGDDLVFNP